MTRAAGIALWATVATMVVAASSAALQPSSAVTSIRFDERRTADLLRRTEGRIDLSELLRHVVVVDVRAEEHSRLVLHVYQMRGKYVVRRFASSAFEAPARGTVLLRDVLRAGEPGFGRFTFDPAHLLEAVEPIPAGAAVDEPGRFIINGVIPFHPKGWEDMETFYIVAAPVDPARSTGSREEDGWPVSRQAPVGIGVVFGTVPGR